MKSSSNSGTFSFSGVGGILGLFSFEVSIQFWRFFIFGGRGGFGGGGGREVFCGPYFQTQENFLFPGEGDSVGFGPRFQPLQQAHASQIVSHMLRMWRLMK